METFKMEFIRSVWDFQDILGIQVVVDGSSLTSVFFSTQPMSVLQAIFLTPEIFICRFESHFAKNVLIATNSMNKNIHKQKNSYFRDIT